MGGAAVGHQRLLLTKDSRSTLHFQSVDNNNGGNLFFTRLKTIRSACLCLALLTMAAAHAEPVPLEPAAFTEYMASKIRAEVGDTPVAVKGPLTLAVGSLQANLDRLYSYCRKGGVTCEIEAGNYAKTASDLLKERSAPLDPDAVRIVIRSTDYIKHAQASLGANASELNLQLRPFVDGLVAVAVLDTPRAVRPLSDKDLEKIGLSKEQLFELGAKNVRAVLSPLSETAKPVAVGKIGTIHGNFYEVGRVTLHDDWTPLASSQDGVLLIALPTTDAVLYISEASPAAIERLKALSRDIARRSPNPLSSAVLRWTKERWELVP